MSKQWKRLGLVSMILALSAAMVFASVALAQGNGPANGAASGNSNATGQAQTYRRGSGGGSLGAGYGLAVQGAWGGADASLVAVAAEVLDMEQADLVAELQSGKTIAQVAEENSVAVQAIVDAYLALRADLLAQAVADGRITQDQADTMVARMTAMVTSKLSQAWQPQGNANCDGTCSGTPGQGIGPNFTDGDGNGVCDNYSGTGRTHRGGHGQASGATGRGGRMMRP